ncbi:MAG: hypothetical protein JWQ58_9 [Reyranella sp.]|nr:hypothetical protein [Reyranella sp.]
MLLGVPWRGNGGIGLNGVWVRRLDKPGDSRWKVLFGNSAQKANVFSRANF